MSSQWIVRPRPQPNAQLRLLCLPFAGGGASAFRSWPGDLPPEVELCAVQLPGREQRFQEEPFDRLALLICALAQGIRDELERPFALFGHSMGALLAFELARELRRQHVATPVHLFISGLPAPQLRSRSGTLAMHHLPDVEFVDRLRTFRGIPDMVLQNEDLLHLLLPTLRADYTLVETYRYAPDELLNYPITAFGGDQDASANRADLTAWHWLTRNTFDLHLFPGDHFFPFRAQAAVVGAISHRLTRAWSPDKV